MIERESLQAINVRIFLADDHPLVRDGMRIALQLHQSWSVCGESDTVQESLVLIRDLRPDIAVVDLSLKDGSGLELIKQIAKERLQTPILVCSMQDESVYSQRVLDAGAKGFIHKQSTSGCLDAAIEKVLSGGIYLSDEASEAMVQKLVRQPHHSPSPVQSLTVRELQIVEALGNGATMRLIADQLHISQKTAETYRERAKRKLNLKTSAELLRFSIIWVNSLGRETG